MTRSRLHGVTGQGNYNTICQVCGWKFKASELRKRWDGLWVCQEDWETRHPMDFYRTIPDQKALPYVLPDREDVPTYGLGYCQFDGTSTAGLVVPRVNSEFLYTYPMTIEFWTYAVPGSLGTNFITIVRNENYFILHNQNGANAGKFRVIVYDSPLGNAWSFRSNYVLPQDSNWYKFEFTAANNTAGVMSVYDASGTQVSTENITPVNLGVLGASTPIVSVGGTPLDANGSWNGGIDELRVWNVIRTAQQLQDYRFTQLSGGEPGLKLYLNFDSKNRFTFDNKRTGSIYTGAQGFPINYPHAQWVSSDLVLP